MSLRQERQINKIRVDSRKVCDKTYSDMLDKRHVSDDENKMDESTRIN